MKGLITTSILAASLVCGAAMAQTATPWYVGASVGQSNYKVDCGDLCDDSDIGLKAFGGYMFTPNFGVEVQYVNLGKLKLDPIFVPDLGTVSGEIKSSGFGASLIAQYPIEQFAVFGKLGFTYMDTKISGSVSGLGSGSESDKSTNFSWGLGAAYNFNPQLGVRVEWERFRAEFEGEKEDVDLYSIGIVYRF